MAAGLHKKTVSTPNAYYPKRLMWSLDWTLYVRRSDRCQEDSVPYLASETSGMNMGVAGFTKSIRV